MTRRFAMVVLGCLLSAAVPLSAGEQKPAGASSDLGKEVVKGAPGLTRGLHGHWAFRLPHRPPLPALRRSEGTRTAIDRFIVAALEKKRLTLNPEADRATLIRRVSFDLTGLPPTPTEIDRFEADRTPTAYQAMVDGYLASPHYGERWGKYWLDAAGYADSNGYFSADSNRPLAYHYRDYVLDSFNCDKPYDRFVREQLAGDELAGYVPGGEITPAMIEPLTATHFLRNAPDGTGESDGNPDEVRTDRYTVLEGNLQITINCLLGLTIQCARCHAHKFEPITHADYYRLQAIFFSSYNPDRWTTPNDRIVTVADKAQREEHQRRNERVNQQIKPLRARLQTAAEPLRKQLLEERLRHLKAPLREAVLRAAATPKDKRTPEQTALLKKHVEPLKIDAKELAKRFPEFAALCEQTAKAVAARERQRPPPLPRLAVLVNTDPNPPAHHILVRGRHNSPGAAVQPGVPKSLSAAGNVYRTDVGRRTAFARWVTAPTNPLFARVMVNRIWQHHFGVGLVATPDNLGQSGASPTHPELLDWLAAEFLRSGWSVKTMHRLILNSAVYRQSSTPHPDASTVDPEDRLLWRFPLRRLDAEALRDAMLAVSGELDRRAGGPYIPTDRRNDGTVIVNEERDGARRRSLYLQQRRSQVATLLELFDAPRLASNCSFRNTSTVPLQSLALLNSDFARTRAAAFARRLEREADADAERRVALAYRLAAGRQPHEEERAAIRRFLAIQQTLHAQEKDSERRAWTDLCQTILASNAFLYVE